MTDGSTRNVRLLIEYDGTGFSGWQVQPGRRTVQGELETQLADLLGRAVRVTAAGRTDAGVHALGQVVNFRTQSQLEAVVFQRALNARLADDVLVLAAEDATPEFNARRHALARRYVYRIEYRSRAVGRGQAWVHRQELDLPAMREAAGHLPGTRDFTSFCIAASEKEDRICQLGECRWEAIPDGLQFWMEANRFLRGMVRSVVGTLVEVGRGARDVEEISTILDARNRSAAGATAPPQGLFLSSVRYAFSWNRRAESTADK